MPKINFRRLSATTIAIAATAALSLGGAHTEAWGGKTSSWDLHGTHNSGKTSSWDLTTTSNAGKTSSWDISRAGKTSSWD